MTKYFFAVVLSLLGTAAMAETLICSYKNTDGQDVTLTLNIEGQIARQKADDSNPFQVLINNEYGIVLASFFALANPADKRLTNTGAHLIVFDRRSGVMKRGALWTADIEAGQLTGRCASLAQSEKSQTM